MCGNDVEATKWMRHIIKGAWYEKLSIKIIVDNVLLYGYTSDHVYEYFRTVLGVLKHHRATINLNNWKWFQETCEFVGMDVAAVVTQPVYSKNDTFTNLEKTNTWGDLHTIIGIFGLYS